MKIVLYSKDPSLKNSPRFGWQDFFKFLAADPPLARPFGGGSVYANSN
jgi:hypothetical protein